MIYNYLKQSETNSDIEEIKSQLGDEGFNQLCKMVKDENSYFALEYFRKDTNRTRLELEYLYKNTIINNRYKKIKDRYSTLTDKHLVQILEVLESITYFCIKYNYAGEEVVHVLNNKYDIPLTNCEDLGKIYDENKLSLKLDYVIGKITQSN